MSYDYIAIPDTEVPRAADPLFQHVLDTYASETNKVITVWRGFAQEDLGFRPHPKSSTVADILKHQLLSERRFFGEFVGTPEPPAAEVLPQTQEVNSYIRSHGRAGAASARVLRPANSSVVDAERSVLRHDATAHLGLLAARAAHLPSSRAAHGVSAIAE